MKRYTETFLIMVEDVDGKSSYSASEDVEEVEDAEREHTFTLRQRYAEHEHSVTLTVPIFQPVPPNYYISDHWLHAETRLPISFKHLILPKSSLLRLHF
jgi:pre-mRNA-splicing helicase BRR2